MNSSTQNCNKLYQKVVNSRYKEVILIYIV